MINNVSLTGRLTKDIDLRYTQSGTAVGSFDLAVQRKFNDKSTGNRETDFIRCQVWSKTAEVMSKYVHKGSQIGVTGRIQTGKYQNKKGDTVYTTDVIVADFAFLDSKADNQIQQSAPQPSFENMGQPITVGDDDLPF